MRFPLIIEMIFRKEKKWPIFTIFAKRERERERERERKSKNK